MAMTTPTTPTTPAPTTTMSPPRTEIERRPVWSDVENPQRMAMES